MGCEDAKSAKGKKVGFDLRGRARDARMAGGLALHNNPHKSPIFCAANGDFVQVAINEGRELASPCY
jgi:hypothetical protein